MFLEKGQIGLNETPPVGRERLLSDEKTLTASAQTLGGQRSEEKCSEEDQVACHGWTICKLRVQSLVMGVWTPHA